LLQSGKKAGDFYTPQPVAKLMTQMCFKEENQKGFFLFDPDNGFRLFVVDAKKTSTNRYILLARIKLVYV